MIFAECTCIAPDDKCHSCCVNDQIYNLIEEVTILKNRLEWREDGHDGIYCRDETIRWLLEANNKLLGKS